MTFHPADCRGPCGPGGQIDGRVLRRAARITLAVLATAAAGPARAVDCPTADDLRTGIRATYADGSTFDYQADAAGLVRVIETPDPAAAESVAFLSRFGIYDVSAQGLSGGAPQAGQVLEYTYAASDGSEPPAPRAESYWMGQSATIYADGARDESVAVMVFGRLGEVRIGGCSYGSIPVTTSYLLGEAWAAQDYDWLPDLGIGLLTRRAGSDAPRASQYRPMALTRLSR